MITKLADAIAHEEGFYVAGSKPQRNNNPGDLEHAPGEIHIGMDLIGRFVDVATGWWALETQLEKFARRKLTLQQAIYVFAPPTENNSARYLADVCAFGDWTPGTTVADALADG